MPYKYAIEMLCDYLGAGKAYYGKEFTYQKEFEWWLSTGSKKKAMHKQTKELVNYIMEDIRVTNDITSITDKERRKRIQEYYESI